MSTLAERLIASREAKTWTQEDLAKKAGITQSFISALETAAQKSSKYLPEIAHALGIDCYWLKTGVTTVIFGDKRINEVVELMRTMNNDGRLATLIKARDFSDEFRSDLSQSAK